MKPTKIAAIVALAAACAAVSWLILGLVYRALPPLPWSGVPTLIIVALAEAYSGMLLRARIHQRPGTKPVEPIAVARTAALAKASAYTAAVIGGVAVDFRCMSRDHSTSRFRVTMRSRRWARLVQPRCLPRRPCTWSTAAACRSSLTRRTTPARPGAAGVS